MSPSLQTHKIDQGVTVHTPNADLRGQLSVPRRSKGLVIFAHGSGSSRLSPRNRYVSQELNRHGFATLLLDLLTETEADDREKVFDIGLLAARLLRAKAWSKHHPLTRRLAVAYFGASTGAAAAIVAAATEPGDVFAVVSRGGRPDLAGESLGRLYAPILLLVGGHDELVIDLNRVALKSIPGSKRLQLVEGASHLFEEPGTLEEVAREAAKWFNQYRPRATKAIRERPDRPSSAVGN